MSVRSTEGGSYQLAIDNLDIVYQGSRGPIQAIDNLSLHVRSGEFIAILGKSGCGKSTLLNAVAGLLKPSRGSIALNGEPVLRPRPDVGVVFQQPTLLPWKTVRQNILAPIRALGRPIEAYAERANKLLDLVGLQAFANHYPNELSGGMQQRVGIARGLIHDPTLLLMDEPFAALDAMTREQMTLELQTFWLFAQKSVVFITHSIPEAVFLADRVVVLSPRPATVIDIAEVNLPRPRTVDTMASPEFSETCVQLRHVFQNMAG